MDKMIVERFDCSDGTHHYSVVQANGEFATCLIHDTPESAQTELAELEAADQEAADHGEA